MQFTDGRNDSFADLMMYQEQIMPGGIKVMGGRYDSIRSLSEAVSFDCVIGKRG
jgi:hypothetical protein